MKIEEFYKTDNDKATFKLNKEIYSKEIILQTSYILLEDVYILIDTDEKYYYLHVKKKNKKLSFEQISEKLLDELIEANSYIEQAKRTSTIRQTILEKALIENTIDSEDIIEKENKIFGDLNSDEFYPKKQKKENKKA